MIIDGRALAKEILARAKTRAAKLARPPLVVALTESDTPVTHSYLAVKTKCATDAGCIFEVKHINKLLRPLEIVDMARTADALIIQLPLPKEMDTKEMCDAIPVGKDADVLSSAARA
ncbi:MAG: tetrahydrofolate dehydrogenase/cyclohydrolase catalytic domain-containing protein, partial [Patescibacteria group bacterium]